MAGERAAGLDERRALMDLVLACILLFVASMPNALREARGLAIDDPVSAAVSAHLFGYVALLPLAAYGLAALAHLVARAAGGRGSFLAARTALFLSALAAAPVALAVAAVGVAAEALPALSPVVTALRFAALGFALWLFAATLAEAEAFATGRVAAVLAASCFGGLLALAAAAGVV
ncbi:MAG: YIP1 family protein [Amaricoccus sp.]